MEITRPGHTQCICDDPSIGKIITTLRSETDASKDDARMAAGFGAALAATEAAVSGIGAPITDNDRRWRHLEHGCQWVSWTETNGETHSFDPRNVGTGYQGDLQSMRATADEQLERQVAKLKSASADGGRKE